MKFDKNRDKINKAVKTASAGYLHTPARGNTEILLKNISLKGRDKNVRTVSRFFLFAEQHCFSHTKEGDAYEKMGY